MSFKKIISLVLFICSLCSVSVFADGKMYWPDKVPPKIPYQRAVIFFENSTETLILQSKYEVSRSGVSSELGWVVPVPSTPILDSMDPELVDYFHFFLSMRSRPEIISIGPIVKVSITIGVMVLLYRRVKKKKRSSAKALGYLGIFFVGFLGFLAWIPLMSAGRLGVAIINEQNVGVYETKTIQSDNSADLIQWLQDNGFRFDEKDQAAFDDYVQRGWCFVTSKIRSDADPDKVSHDGLAAPLILQFKTSNPVYPTKLTGTGGHKTEMLIYLLADSPMSCDGRLKRWFAGPETRAFSNWESYRDRSTEKGRSSALKLPSLPYLTKFKGIMTPQQMEQDITFSPEATNVTVRLRKIVW